MYINLTPHTIIIQTPNGVRLEVLPSGTLARVAMREEVIGTCPITGAPVVKRVAGAVEGLPVDGALCIVSSMVLDHCKGMANVFAPDTGATAIRNEKGHVVAVTRLVAA